MSMVELSVAIIKKSSFIFQDFALGRSGSLFEAMLRGCRVALNKIGMQDLQIIVGETGWPTAGGRGVFFWHFFRFGIFLRSTAEEVVFCSFFWQFFLYGILFSCIVYSLMTSSCTFLS